MEGFGGYSNILKIWNWGTTNQKDRFFVSKNWKILIRLKPKADHLFWTIRVILQSEDPPKRLKQLETVIRTFLNPPPL